MDKYEVIGTMRIYEVWQDSNHKIRYYFGYYLRKEDAELVLDSIKGGDTASGPEKGINEIIVCRRLVKIEK